MSETPAPAIPSSQAANPALTQALVQALTPAEWRLIESLRELPDGQVKDKVHGVLLDLLFYVRNPRCQGMLPEGFPCGDPRSTCEECHRIWDLLEAFQSRVKA